MLFFISCSFHPYFIWNFWSVGRHLFYQSKFGANLNPFKIKLIRFENRIGRTVLPAPPVSAALTTSPRCLVPHPAADDRAPCHIPAHLSVTPSCVAPTPPPYTVARQHAARTRSGRAAVTSMPRHHATPHHAQASPLPLSLSRSASMQRRPLRAPSPPIPFKTEPPPTGRIFLPHAPFVSSVHARALHTCPPPPERRRRPPPSGERPLSCSIPQTTAASSPRWSPSSCRTPPHVSTTTGDLSSLTPATASASTSPLRPLTSSRH
jgi:hypothetical protein